LYVLRPDLSAFGKRAAPELLIDSAPLGRLELDRYVDVVLGVGAHTLVLRPGPQDEPLWAAEVQVVVEPGHLYFVAAWPIPDATSHLRLIPGPAAIPFIPVRESVAILGGVKFEQISQEEALTVLETMYRAPLDSLSPR
jgi:hypothetical protein